jgi:hypothetical protein
MIMIVKIKKSNNLWGGGISARWVEIKILDACVSYLTSQILVYLGSYAPVEI